MTSSSLESDLNTLFTEDPLDFHHIIDQFPMAVLILDRQGRVSGWNRVARKTFGYEAAEVLGQPLAVLPQGDREIFDHLLARVLEGDVVNEMERTWIDSRGKPIPVDIALSAFKPQPGPALGVLAVVSDITERKWAQATLEGTARRLSKLSRLGKTVLADLSIWKVLHTIIDEILPILQGTRRMAILLREGQSLRFAAMGGDLTEDYQDVRIPCSKKEWQLICTHQTLFLLPEDFLTGAEGFSMSEGQLFAIPLRANGDVLGVMLFTGKAGETFQDEVRMLIDDAANWASIAILNANQHQKLQRQLQESQAIMSISQALSETLEIDRIFEIIAQNAQEIILNSDLVAIHNLDPAERDLTLVASSKGPVSCNGILLERLGSEMVDRIVSQMEPVCIPDVRQAGLKGAGEGMCSLLAVSIMGEKAPFGIISAQSAVPDAFSPADIRLLKQLRIEASLALQNATLYQNEKTQREWAEILSQVGAVLTSSVDLDVVLNTVLDQISMIIPLSSVHIILIENDEVVNVRELQGETTPKGHRMPSSLLEIKNIREIIETGEPLVIPDTSDSEKWEYVPESAWIKSYMGIPLKYGEKTIGLININSVKPDSFSEGMIHILKSLAAYATIGVQNARLIRDLQESLKQEKQMREQLIQSDRLAAMGRMAASIAHEINNPLQGILGCLELAHTTMGQPKRQKKYLDLASSALESLNDIVERILSFQRPLQGTMEHTDVRELIEEVLALANRKIESENITVMLKLDRKMPEVYGIPGQLKQVFLNLTLNAVEAMGAEGTLTISNDQVMMEEPWLQISFSDTGKGISEEELQHLFEPFYSTKTDGTGLGLWVSQNIIDSHRGRITSESKLDEGTTFTVWLPLNPPEG
jgi:PAS domain S-box-containing protein